MAGPGARSEPSPSRSGAVARRHRPARCSPHLEEPHGLRSVDVVARHVRLLGPCIGARHLDRIHVRTREQVIADRGAARLPRRSRGVSERSVQQDEEQSAAAVASGRRLPGDAGARHTTQLGPGPTMQTNTRIVREHGCRPIVPNARRGCGREPRARLRGDTGGRAGDGAGHAGRLRAAARALRRQTRRRARKRPDRRCGHRLPEARPIDAARGTAHAAIVDVPDDLDRHQATRCKMPVAWFVRGRFIARDNVHSRRTNLTTGTALFRPAR